MMEAFRVEEYFLQLSPELNRTDVVGKHVYSTDGLDVGMILKYNQKTGFARIRLYDKVDYKYLLNAGVPMNQIIFGISA